MALFEPVHATTALGTTNSICLLVTEVNDVTALPHTEIVSPSDELTGKPVPVMVAMMPPPGDVTAGVTLDTVIGTV